MLLHEAASVRVGDTQVAAVYVGDLKVWPSDAGDWELSDIPGLTLWVEADDVPVTSDTWITTAPSRVGPSLTGNVQVLMDGAGGFKTFDFHPLDGADIQQMLTTSTNITFGPDFTVLVVVDARSPQPFQHTVLVDFFHNGGGWVVQQDGGGPGTIIGWRAGGNYQVGSGPTYPSVPCIVEAYKKDGAGKLTIGNSSVTVNGNPSMDNVNAPLRVANYLHNDQRRPLLGKVSAVAVWPRALNSTELDQARGYLQDKYWATVDPEKFLGCVLAFNARDVAHGAVTSWSDRSPSANHLIPMTGTAVSAEDYVTCTTANVLQTTSGVNITGAAPRHMFMMLRSRWVNGAFMGYGSNGNAQLFDLWYYTGQGTIIWHGYGGANDTVAGAPTFTADEWHLLEVSYDGSTMRVYLDEAAPQTKVVGALATTATPWLFGQGHYSPAGDFDMKSFYLYDRVLSDAERLQIRARMTAVSEPVWAPDSLPGLVTWLDAIDYLPGNWPNKANGPTPTFVGTPAPAWSATTMNGMPTVRFKTSEGRLRSTWSDPVYDWTVIYLVRWVGPGVGRAFSVQYPPSNELIGLHTSQPDWMYVNGGSITPGTGWNMWSPGPGPWRMYGGDSASVSTYGVARFFIDGTLIGSANDTLGLTGGWAISGYGPGTEETMDIEIAELLIWNRQLSDDERAEAERYLIRKWWPVS